MIDRQFFVDPGDVVFSYQVAPELLDVQVFPLFITAASLVPSEEEVMDCQFFVDPGDVVFSVHVLP